MVGPRREELRRLCRFYRLFGVLRMNKMTVAFVIAALGLVSAAQATSVTIPANKRLGPVPTMAGTGLDGQVWTGAGVHNTTSAAAWTASKPAAGSFVGMNFNYSNQGEANTVGNFLGTDAAPLSNAVKNALGDWTIYKFTGKIALPSAGQYDFKITSDDGFVMKVGDQKVAEFAGERSSATTNGWLTVSQSGLYSIEVLYFNGPATGDLKIEYKKAGTNDPFKVLAKPDIYQMNMIPTPGAVALVGMGGLLASRRRRA
jgi:hypothetical protein